MPRYCSRPLTDSFLGIAAQPKLGQPLDPRGVSPKFRQFVKTEFGIRVRNGAWYKQAMTHGSMMAELEPGEQSNERLEFLGDSILGAVAAELVFFAIPTRTRGR